MAFDDGKKTVSGSIAHTDDAATKVPFVSVKCGIATTLDGVTEITAYNVPSVNLLSLPDVDFTLFGVHIYTVKGILYMDGASTTEISSTRNEYKALSFYLPKGTYYFTRASYGLPSYIYKYSDKSQVRVNNGSFTLTEGTMLYMGYYIYQKTFSEEKFNQIIGIGSSSVAYVDTVPKEVYTASLGRTIYGGQADIVNGEGKNRYAKLSLAVADMNNSETYPGWKNSGVRAIVGGGINKPITDGVTTVGQYYNINTNGTTNDIIFLPPTRYNNMSQTDWKTQYPDLIIEILVEIPTPETFTFTPITPTPETVGEVNNVYCNTGNTEVTYYDNAHGFSEVTVNKTGKNLFGGWTKGYGVNSTTGEIFSRQDSAISDYISVVPNTNYYISGFSNEISSMVAYYDRNKTYISRTSGSQRLSLAVTTPTNCRYMILYQYRAGDQTASIDVIDNMQTQLEFGNEQTEYEPYVAPVSKTAYLHKVIYGGQADVVKGTCEPKNLFDDSTFPRTATENNTYYASFQSILAEGNKYKIPTIHIEPDVAYVLSFDVECNTEPFNASVGIGTGYYSKDIASVNNNTSGRISVPFTLTSALKEQYGDILSFRVPRYSSTREFTFTISNVQLEKASSASEYVPHFEPFSFPPISMSTDEGENTLFANEGDSAITYRKAVD